MALCTLILTGCAANGRGRLESVRNTTAWTFDHGGVIRGNVQRRRVALIFTGGDHGEGTEHILDTLADAEVAASFFVTGSYLANGDNHDALRRMVDQGHYLGPHSDAHLLYCPWDDRSRTLVTRAEFRADLQANIDNLRQLGALQGDGPIYFVPPYEWFNAQHVRWARELGVAIVNYTPGSGTQCDWIPERQAGFVSSTVILEDLLDLEGRALNGLNGYVLLLHLGALRQDKTYLLLDSFIDRLSERGYRFVRIDEMFPEPLAVETARSDRP
ncbi:MAG: polysaccharide deacetylase family protein [bacterium]|nr:polysaccharide deacetylase family protein [bacterium]